MKTPTRLLHTDPREHPKMVRHHLGSCLQSLPVNVRPLSFLRHRDLSRCQPCQMTPVASAIFILGSRMTDATQLSHNTASIREVNVHNAGLGATVLPLRN